MTLIPTVAVIGGGASGCTTAAQLARQAKRLGRAVDLLVLDPGTLGEGVAYGTTDARHLLNVPARGMSMWPDDPEHFVRWLRRQVDPDFADTGFAPRTHYARYLRESCRHELDHAPRVRFQQLRTRAVDVRPHGRRIRISTADGTSRSVDAVVLSTGPGPVGSEWAPPQLRRSVRFLQTPWAVTPDPLVAHDEIVFVGSGLSMLDMAQSWHRPGTRMHVVSRHGLRPLTHASELAAPVPVALEGTGPITFEAARHLVVDHMRSVTDAGGDWRQAIDGLRPVTQLLWQRMPEESRRRFLRSGARRWDRARHRTEPGVHAWYEARRAEGAVVEHAASVVDAVEEAGCIRLVLSDGDEIAATVVLNCTGTTSDIRATEDPLLMNLLRSGLVRPGPLGLGLAADEDGRVLPADPDTTSSVWSVGPLRRGELWESTAMPEIRQQAERVAAGVLAGLPSSRLPRRPRDPYGLPLTASGPAAAIYNEALGRVLRVQSGAEDLLVEAIQTDPGFALGYAVLALLGVEGGCQVDVEAAISAAERTAVRVDLRERRFIEVAATRVRHPGPAADAALLAYLHAYPEDALAVSLAVPTIAFGGATELPAESWALVESLGPAYGSDWWYLGLLAFIRQEQERHDEADELARRALAAEPASGHAVHAKAHVHYETGDHEAGLRWLDAWVAGCGARASHRAHFSWHAALHELALGDDLAAAARYQDQLAPPVVCGVRALVDSASLLWRGHTVGAWPSPDLTAVLDVVPVELLAEPPTPFVALHAAVALAAQGDCQGLARIRRSAASRDRQVFQTTVVPLVEALSHMVHGDHDLAVSALAELQGVDRLGGSAAQQEIVEETLLLCSINAGRSDVAGRILSDRLRRRPSPRDQVRLDRLKATQPA